MEENFSMEWSMKENFSMEWNMEWKIFGMEWKRNGRKLPVWNMEKSSSIPYHALDVLRTMRNRDQTYTATRTTYNHEVYKFLDQTGW